MGIDGGHDGSVPDGEAILLLHGFTNTHRSWARLLAAGVAERFAVQAPDIRGHGAASAAVPVDLEAVLDDIDALAPQRCVLLGYSQGGRIALHAALDPRMAGRVERLVLIGASPGIADPAERRDRRAADDALADRLERMSVVEFAELWEATPVLAGLPDELAAHARRDRLENTPGGLAAALRGLGTGRLPSLWSRLGELTMPVTLVAGERDAKFTALAHEMAKLIPDARVEVVAGAGHQVHLEQPVALAALLSGDPRQL
jgi:2-succinyl-6-hydroxy-2,4-cyclohexadiene-1-carboxylate synthase